MNHTKQKIKRLEAKMNSERVHAEQHLLLLKSYLRRPAILAGGIILSAGLGFLIGRKTGLARILRSTVTVPLFVMRAVNNVKMLSWLV